MQLCPECSPNPEGLGTFPSPDQRSSNLKEPTLSYVHSSSAIHDAFGVVSYNSKDNSKGLPK